MWIYINIYTYITVISLWQNLDKTTFTTFDWTKLLCAPFTIDLNVTLLAKFGNFAFLLNGT